MRLSRRQYGQSAAFTAFSEAQSYTWTPNSKNKQQVTLALQYYLASLGFLLQKEITLESSTAFCCLVYCRVVRMFASLSCTKRKDSSMTMPESKLQCCIEGGLDRGGALCPVNCHPVPGNHWVIEHPPHHHHHHHPTIPTPKQESFHNGPWWVWVPLQLSLPLATFSFTYFPPLFPLITPAAGAESPCSPLLSALTPNSQTASPTEQSERRGSSRRAEGRLLRFLFACLKEMKLAGRLVYIRGQLVTDNALIWREIDPGHRILDEIS